MRTRLIGSIGVCLTAAGLTLGDGTRSSHAADDPPAKPKELTPAEPIQTPPTPAVADGNATSPTTPTNQVDEKRLKAAQLRDDHIGPGNTYWADLEYLMWWTKDGPLPVLLAVSGTGEMIGGRNFSYAESPGGRLTFGTWLDVPHQLGFEASGFILARNQVSATLESDSTGNPLIVRPVVNALTDAGSSFIVSFPGRFSGSTDVTSESRLWGAEANIVRNLVADCGFVADLLVGFRYIDLDENLNIDQSTTVLSGPGILFAGVNGASGPGSVLTLSDRFSTRNSFFLGQFGARSSIKRGPLSVDVLCKVGFGPNWQQVRIDGTSQLTSPSVNAAAVGGLLAQAGTNIGRSWQSWFAVVPEVGAQVGWDLTPYVKLHVGYSFLYMNSVARPGDQINPIVNPAFVPSSGVFGSPSAPAEPSLVFHRTEYWVHGINAGVMLRY